MRKSLLSKFISYFNLLYQKGLSYGLAGNASVFENNVIYITPSGFPKEGITLKDLVKVKLNGKAELVERASRELDFHLWIYKNFKDIKTIFHAHTFYANIYFLKRRKIPEDEAIKKENVVVISRKNWKEKVKDKVSDKTKIVHVKNHGSFSFGKSPDEAFSVLDHFENLCKIELLKGKGLKVRQAQSLIKEIYFNRDTKREFSKNLLWFIEEVGEWLQAIRKGSKEEVKNETADVFAWFLTICNLIDIDLEDVFKEKYFPFCPKCKKSPCQCQNI
ncbi:MAG: class II aldolase/adducin family protein [Candidatus Hydrothermales bacterium]